MESNDVDLVRASAGRLVVTLGHEILTSTIAAFAASGNSDGGSSDLDGEIETLAISPDGSTICIVVDGDDGLEVRSRRFGKIVERGVVPEGFSSTVAAIGDDGTVVIAGLRSATEAVIAVASSKGRPSNAGRLTSHAQFSGPLTTSLEKWAQRDSNPRPMPCKGSRRNRALV